MSVIVPPANATVVPSRSLRTRVLSAGAWSLASYAGSQAVRVASSMVMTRLLMPEAYGLYTLVTTYVVGINMFSDVGLTAYLFQSEKAHKQEFADGIWTLAAVRGLIVWLVGLGLAWPMAYLYNEPRLLPLLAAASLGQLISTLQSTKLTLANRDLKQKALAVFGLANQAAGMIVQIGLAWWFRSVWALVVGSLISELIRVTASQFLFPGKSNRWRWDSAIARELRHFSKWVYISSIMIFLGGQADRLILGKVMPIEFLGLYGIAMNFAALPLSLVQQGSGLLSPIVVQLRHRNDLTIQQKIKSARDLLLKAGAALVASMCVGAPAFYGILYDSRYHAAGFICSILAVSIWASVLESSVAGLLIAFGDAKSEAFCNIVRVVGAAAGMTIGYELAGSYGIIVGAAGGAIGAYIARKICLCDHNIHLGWGDLRHSSSAVVLAIVGWTMMAVVRHEFRDFPLKWASLLAAITICFVAAWRQRRLVISSYWQIAGGVRP